jgi:hypothetical protein
MTVDGKTMPNSCADNVRLDLRALVYRDDEWWIAHCLELDLPAEGSTADEAIECLMELVSLQVTAAIQDGNLASVFTPAPGELWRLYALGQDRTKSGDSADLTIPPVERFDIRELAAG